MKKEMKWFTKVWAYPLLILNGILAAGLLICAYSPYLPPTLLPWLSISGLAFPLFLLANGLFLFVWLVLHPRYLAFPLVTLLLCCGPIRTYFPLNFGRRNVPEGSMKVLSYNTLMSGLTEKEATASHEVIHYLETSGADIICLQECKFSVLKKVEKKNRLFAEYPYKSYWISEDNEAKAHGLACLSKYPLLSVENISFGETPNGCAKYLIKKGNDTLTVMNCHLQTNQINEENKSTYEALLRDPKEILGTEGSKELVKKLMKAARIRSGQADTLHRIIQTERPALLIVCGDFNDSPISYAHRTIAKGLKDAFVHSGNGIGFSYNRNKLYFRIDHILSTPSLKAYDCTVDRSIQTSDHYPVFCFFSKK